MKWIIKTVAIIFIVLGLMASLGQTPPEENVDLKIENELIKGHNKEYREYIIRSSSLLFMYDSVLKENIVKDILIKDLNEELGYIKYNLID